MVLLVDRRLVLALTHMWNGPWQGLFAESSATDGAVICPYVKAPGLARRKSQRWFHLWCGRMSGPVDGAFRAGQDGFRERRPNRPSAPVALGQMRVFVAAAHVGNRLAGALSLRR
jgi:hypothetical protein